MPNATQRFVRTALKDWIDSANGRKKEKSINGPPKGSEAWYRDKLAEKLKGKIEVKTPAGRIDILTKTEVIELKVAKDWKAAIGQVKTYGRYYPNHSLRIHLFGELKASRLKLIQENCQHEGISLTHE